MGRFAIAFLFGHCAVFSVAELPAAGPTIICITVSLGIAALLRSHLLVAFVLGIAWAWFGSALRLAEDLPAALEGIDLLVCGSVASLPDASDVDPQFDFAVHAAPAGVPSRLRLAWYRAQAHPQPGERWQLVVRLKRRNGFANPGGFDYEGYLFREGFGATGYIREDERNQRLAPPAGYPIARARAWLADRIAAAADAQWLGILQGLSVGDTQAMTVQQWRVFAATGTTHLMAISGLHIGMIATFAAWLGGRIVRWRGAQRRRVTAIQGEALGGILAAVGYSMLAGLSIPTQRTLAMLCIYFLARVCRRESSARHALSLALIGVLLIDPFAPLAVGAWLSFGAVAVILIALSGRLTRDSAIRNFTRVQIAVTVGLVPLLLAGFGSLSLVSPLANAIAVPAFTVVIVPLVLLGTLAAAIWLPAGSFVLDGVSALLASGWPLLDSLAQLPFAQWHFAQPPVLACAALVAGAMLWLLPGIWPMRLAGVLLCLPALAYRPPAPQPGAFGLALLDVGQGLAVVVRTQGHVLVYDTGPAFRTGRDLGELVVVPYLHHRGIGRIDRLVVSHGDLDHQGGMRSILAGVRVDDVRTGPSVRGAPAGAQPCARGQRWQWDDVEFEFLHPDAARASSDTDTNGDNDSSCVLRIAGRRGSALLTGDIERAAESALLAAGLPPADIVIVPHHGSRTSSTAAFVQASRPRIALFAAGYRNRWGFPKGDVIERWRAGGAGIFTTIDSGAIEVVVGSGGAHRLREFRRTRARFWQRTARQKLLTCAPDNEAHAHPQPCLKS